MKKAFTLIELLVVIAIIGILSAMVLVSLGSARNKAKDARIKSDVSQTRVDIENYAAGNGGSYASYAVNATLNSDVNTQNGLSTGITATTTANTYAISADLTGTASICVDSTGLQYSYTALKTTAVGTAAACPTTGNGAKQL
ncbi:MAG: type II secretion system protein [Candidatus Berkelbacteria bacterium]